MGTNIDKTMKLSIITINYNNAEGLRKTLASVAAQTYADIEHIIVDGASSDGSVGYIEAYAKQDSNWPSTSQAHQVVWISEKDKGIYHAMNKGIRMATGDYIQILNSGDMIYDQHVTERMMAAMAEKGEKVEILYGNMIKVNAHGEVVGKSGKTEYSLRQFYSSTLNHDCAYIRRDLFEEYGLYDEHLKIVSDWKWYLQAIGLGKVKPNYVDIDVTIFDDGGISETNISLRNAERRQVLEELLPPAVLWDYDTHAFEMEQMKRLRRWHLYGVVYFMERVLFKFEKWFFK